MVRFEEPLYILIVLLALAIYPFLQYYHKKQKEKFQKFADPELMPALAKNNDGKFKIRALLASFATILLAIALANPQWSTTKNTLSNAKSDIFVVLDVSRSMTAEDIKPSRLDKAKQVVYRLIDQMRSNRMGLILFAGRAYLQMPLTEDLGAIETFVGGADPDMIPTQGTAIGSSIDLAMRMFGDDNNNGKMILVISDGEDHDKGAEEAAEKARKSGAQVFTIGVGTIQGGTMPIYNVGILDVKKDDNGQPIITKLNAEGLKNIAKSGGGEYFNADNGDALTKSIKSVTSGDKKKLSRYTRYKDYESFYAWFLWPAMLILLFLFFQDKMSFQNISRKRKSTILSILALLGMLSNIHAQEFMSQARNADKLYKNKEYALAEEKYDAALKQDQNNQVFLYNRSNTQYQQNKFQDAEKGYDLVLKQGKLDENIRSKTYFNQGNNYFKQEKYSDAINSYKNSLKLNPTDVEAKKNLSIALKKKQDKQKQKDKEQNKDKQKDQKDQNKDQDKKQGDKQEDSADNPKADQSKQEAERLLKIIENEEKNVMRKLPKQKTQNDVNEKDW